jgi:hypothetical protein
MEREGIIPTGEGGGILITESGEGRRERGWGGGRRERGGIDINAGNVEFAPQGIHIEQVLHQTLLKVVRIIRPYGAAIC